MAGNLGFYGFSYAAGAADISSIRKLPNAYPNLAYWFDAQAISGVSNNTPLATWYDQSGNGRNLTAPAGLQPTYLTGGINSRPCVSFNGINQYLIAAGATFDNFTLITAVYITGPTINNMGIITLCPATGDDWNSDNGFTFVSKVYKFELVQYSRGVVIDTSANSMKAFPQIVTLQFRSGSALVRINGAPDGVSNRTNVTIASNYLLFSARYSNAIAAPYGKNDFGEVVMYSDAKTTQEIADIETMLMQKWGIIP